MAAIPVVMEDLSLGLPNRPEGVQLMIPGAYGRKGRTFRLNFGSQIPDLRSHSPDPSPQITVLISVPRPLRLQIGVLPEHFYRRPLLN